MTDPDFEQLKRAMIKRHLDQLQPHELVEAPLERAPIFATFDDLVTWTNDSMTQIQRGKNNQVYGGAYGSPIDFNNAFVPFMESAAVYMRDTSMVIRAVNLYRSGANDEDAITLMENSTQQISTLADMWGMYFIQICDFVTRHPDGHSMMVGPFCGAFIPKDYKTSPRPYMGVAFKGTNFTSRELINDLLAAITVYATGRVWQSQVAQGFYFPVFSTFNKTPSLMPYIMVRQAMQDIANGAQANLITHLTGHSLGGAYSSLTYAQLSIDGTGTNKATLGDLYTFGAPRVGRGDFAIPFRDAVHSGAITKGSAWRVVNKGDPVAKLPASPLWPLSRDPYIHIDAAYMIYPDQTPVAQPTEIGTHPTWPFVYAIKPHYTTEYYKSLTFATTGRPPPHNVVAWGTLPLLDVTYSSEDIVDKPFWDHETTTSSFILEKKDNYVFGTIKYGSFVGEITALGHIDAKFVSAKRFNFDSAAELFKKENNCVFKKEARTQLGLYFIMDGALVGYASIVTENALGHGVETDGLTRGSCIWTFDETPKVLAIENTLAREAASIFVVN